MIPHNQEHVEAAQAKCEEDILKTIEKLTDKGQRQARAILEAEKVLKAGGVSYFSFLFTEGFKDATEGDLKEVGWFHHGFNSKEAFDENGKVSENYKKYVQTLEMKMFSILYERTLSTRGCPAELQHTPIGIAAFLKIATEMIMSNESTPYNLSDDEY